METTKILSEYDLAEDLSTVLDRAHHGERFIVERNGEKLAVISPLEADATIGVSGQELMERIGHVCMPGDGFGDDIESARANVLPVPVVPWPD